jgi:predicted transposase YdaD
MILPEGMKRTFWDEMKTYEEERKMPYITSVEEIGYDRGKTEEAQSLILRLLNRKLVVLPDRTIDRINKLSITHLESLGEALLDFDTIEDLTTWLETHSG